jgi:4-hydroxy-2-oxoheptanedioate aldolase
MLRPPSDSGGNFVRENTVKSIWKRGGAAVNGWMGIPSSVAAEGMAQAGWDSLTADLQHGLIDYQTAVSLFQAIATTPTIPLARVPWNEPGVIMKLLDAGAFGIICPMINTRAECEAFVGACRYAPAGYRSVGPTRALWLHGGDYVKAANDTVLTFAMIETRKAMENLDDILSTPGLDAVYVGPADLGLSLGGEPRGDQTDPKIVDAIQTILKACKKHKVYAGIHCGSPEYARKAIGWGFQFTTILSDNALLVNAAKAAVSAMREGNVTGAQSTGKSAGSSMY